MSSFFYKTKRPNNGRGEAHKSVTFSTLLGDEAVLQNKTRILGTSSYPLWVAFFMKQSALIPGVARPGFL